MSEAKPRENEVLGAPELDGNIQDIRQESEPKPSQENTPEVDVESARAELLALPEERLNLPFDDTPEGDQPQYIDRAMKKASLRSELKTIRDRLPLSQRQFSRAIHQPVVRQASDFTAKTISRPYGLLGGGIVAFCGSLVYLLFSKYIGLKYNYLMFLYLFVVGYLFAVIIEFIYKSIKRSRH